MSRYLALIAEVPDEREKLDHALALAEALVAIDPDRALSIAHMAYKADPRNARALDVMITVMTAKGRLGKAEVLKNERAKLEGVHPTAILDSRSHALGAAALLGTLDIGIGSSPVVADLGRAPARHLAPAVARGGEVQRPAARLDLQPNFSARDLDAEEASDTRMSELDFGSSPNEATTVELSSLFPMDAHAAAPAVAAPALAESHGHPGARVFAPAGGFGGPHLVAPAAAGPVDDQGAEDHAPAYSGDAGRAPGYSGGAAPVYSGSSAPTPVYSGGAAPPPVYPGASAERPFGAYDLATHAANPGVIAAQTIAAHALAAQAMAAQAFAAQALAMHQQQRRQAAPHSEAAPAPMQPEAFWSPIQAELVRMARATGDEASRAAGEKVAAEADTVRKRTSAQASAQLAAALAALPAAADAGRRRALEWDLAQSLWGSAPDAECARFLEANALTGQDPGFFGLYLDSLLAEGAARRALHHVRRTLADKPQLLWAKTAFRRLPAVYATLGAKFFAWTEDDGVEALRKRLEVRPEPSLRMMVLSSPA